MLHEMSKATSTIPKLASAGFRRAVDQSRYPILLEFYTEWCPTCGMMDPILSRLRGEFRRCASIFRVDADAEWELVRDFGIQGVPTFVILRNSRVRVTLVGSQTIQRLRRELIRAGDGSSKRAARTKPA